MAPTNEELVEALVDVVHQACWTEDRVDSCAISAYADAMILLGSMGRLEITHQRGRRIIGHWKGGFNDAE